MGKPQDNFAMATVLLSVEGKISQKVQHEFQGWIAMKAGWGDGVVTVEQRGSRTNVTFPVEPPKNVHKVAEKAGKKLSELMAAES